MPAEDGVAATERLLRSAFGMYRDEWTDNSSVEFHLSHGDWIRLRRCRKHFVLVLALVLVLEMLDGPNWFKVFQALPRYG